MDRENHPPRPQRGKPAIGGVIGTIELVQPPLHLLGTGMAVRGDDGAVIQLHHQGRVILTPVRVDHQTAEIRQDHRAVQKQAQCAGKPGGVRLAPAE